MHKGVRCIFLEAWEETWSKSPQHHRKSAYLVANSASHAAAKLLCNSPGSCYGSHSARLRHAYLACSLGELLVPIACLIQKLRHLCSTQNLSEHSLLLLRM